MNHKNLFLAILLCSNIGCYNLKAQSNPISNVISSVSSIIYTDHIGRDLVGIKVGGIWWAPVDMSIGNKKNGTGNLFEYPESNPCPSGWRLPTFDELKKLQRIVSGKKGEFSYETKGLKIKSDDGKSVLFIPADGVIDSSGTLRKDGLSGGFWSSSKSGQHTSYNFYFRGNALSIGSSDVNSKLNIRCVCEM